MILIFTIVVVLTIVYSQSEKENLLHTVEDETTEMLNNVANITNKFSNERVANLELMADYVSVLDGNDEEVVKFLDKQAEMRPDFYTINFINLKGEIFSSDGLSFQARQTESLEKAFKGEVSYTKLFSLRQEPEQIVTAIRVPIKKDGTIIGVVTGTINMGDHLSSLSKEFKLPGELYLYKKDELVFSTTNQSFGEKVPNSNQIINELQEKQKGSILINKNAAHYVMYQRVGEDWTVLVDSYSDEVEEQSSTILLREILIIFITFLLLASILIYIRRNEVREDNMLKRDLLTKLPNRVVFEEKLFTHLDSKSYKEFTLFFISINRFKEINERNGYLTGDRVLFKFSKKIQALAGRNTLYRIGGDEFAILVPTHSDEELESLLSNLVKLMEKPIELLAYEKIWMTVSLGIRKSEIDDSPDLMMQDATFAVHEAKKQGGNRAVFFSQELANQNKRAKLIANNVVHALQNNEYYMVYQPVYDLSSHEVTSYEALVRWDSPLIGPVSPMEFIPFLEENDLIVPLGNWVIRNVVRQVNMWEQEGHADFQVAINISVKQMIHVNFAQDVKSIIREERISPHRLIFEITETVAVQNSELASKVLSELNILGVKTSLDDFGTGYSSLSILTQLPIQQLKVDRSFIVDMEQNRDKSLVILKGIIDISKNLGLSTIMEGVETLEQLDLLKSMGAQKIQGYLISRPVVAELAMELRKQTWKY